MQEEEDIKPCTFQPNLHARKYRGIYRFITLIGRSPEFKQETMKKLYEDAISRKEKREKEEVPPEIQVFERSKEDCTFFPNTLHTE